jgi:ABC-2 type transport system permease protein
MIVALSRSTWGLRLGLARAALELRGITRDRAALISAIGMPLVLLVVLGAVFKTDRIDGTGVDFSQYVAAGLVGNAIMSTTFVGLGTGIVSERDNGTLKRLYGTPMPQSAYLVGKIATAIVLCLVQATILLAVGIAAFGLHLPSTPGRWLTLLWVLVLGVVACALLGITISSVPQSARTASVVINLPYLVLQFLSGVFWVFDGLPKPLQQIGAIFPLKWITQGVRSAVLPDSLLSVEPAASWEHGRIALVLAGWLVVGSVLALRTFRWKQLRAD